MLGLEDIKGTLHPGADADLVILNETEDSSGAKNLSVHEVWKFGVPVGQAKPAVSLQRDSRL